MKTNIYFTTILTITFGLFLLSTQSVEARHCRSSVGFNFNVTTPTPPPTVVTYYQAPVYQAPVYYSVAPVPMYAPVAVYQPVQVYRPVYRVYQPQQHRASFSFGWFR